LDWSAGSLACMSVRFGRSQAFVRCDEFFCNYQFIMQNNAPNRWHSRGYLPHFDGGQTIQFLTYRLADSMPQNILEKWRVELENNEITDADFRRRIEIYLDQGYGNCWLKRPDIAEIVEENLLHFDDVKYKLYAWVIMPNHLHLLLKPLDGFILSEIVHSCKSFTANRANKILGRSGRFWFPEPFDRFIRDQKHFESTVSYIENNPVKAKLCVEKSDWHFSSAFAGKVEIAE
jgi:REP element-mobilizing transposase RayT